jgi:hypothetical protein
MICLSFGQDLIELRSEFGGGELFPWSENCDGISVFSWFLYVRVLSPKRNNRKVENL